MDKSQLPDGTHWGLKIDTPCNAEDAGSFTGGGWKLIWHTTEGTGHDGMVRVLTAKRAAPHIVISPSKGNSRVTQMIPFTRAARALMHPSGPDTNRANCIQVEICGFAKDSPKWEDWFYRDLAALAVLIEHRVEIPRRAPRSFATVPRRMSGEQFVSASGHYGHQHVPGNDHWDPGAMRVNYLFSRMAEVEERYK